MLEGQDDKPGAEITLKLYLKTQTKSSSLFNHLPCSDFFGNTHFCHDELLIPFPSSHFGGTRLPQFGFAMCVFMVELDSGTSVEGFSFK